MNREWSALNKEMQLLLKKKETFAQGMDTLMELRRQLMEEIMQFRKSLLPSDFSAMPYPNAKGYHSKTIAYSLWHIFRIEDIVAHSLIAGDEQVFFREDFQKRIHSPIITTGNELSTGEMEAFSKALSLDALYQYMEAVDAASTSLLRALSFSGLKEKMTEEKRKQLESLQVVSTDESAGWLIDYWCGKDVKGLIQMPFSRHWIMHVEACLKIRNKLLGLG